MPGHADADGPPDVSIVVPMLDAAERIDSVHEHLAQLMGDKLPPSELILVDDGSSDATWRGIQRVTSAHDRVVGVRLASNVGQTGALCAGFSVARGRIVITMDDDLEADPSDALRFVEAVRSGADFASGWRVGPRPPVRATASWIYNQRLRRWGLPFHDAGCGFNGLTLGLARELAEAGWEVRQHRMKPAIAQLTSRIVEVPIQVRRTTTSSHHSTRSLAASWLDVEFTFGSLTPARFAAVAIVAPWALATWLTAATIRRPGARAQLPLAFGALVVGALAADVMTRALSRERIAAMNPAFEIVDVIGGGHQGR